MASVTISIPLTTLPAGLHTFGPAVIPAGLQFIDFTFDRTVVGGLNAAPVTTTISLRCEFSFDGGATWVFRFGLTTPGGIGFDDNGNQWNDVTGRWGPYVDAQGNPVVLPVGTLARITLNVSASVAVSGSVTLN